MNVSMINHYENYAKMNKLQIHYALFLGSILELWPKGYNVGLSYEKSHDFNTHRVQRGLSSPLPPHDRPYPNIILARERVQAAPSPLPHYLQISYPTTGCKLVQGTNFSNVYETNKRLKNQMYVAGWINRLHGEDHIPSWPDTC